MIIKTVSIHRNISGTANGILSGRARRSAAATLRKISKNSSENNFIKQKTASAIAGAGFVFLCLFFDYKLVCIGKCFYPVTEGVPFVQLVCLAGLINICQHLVIERYRAHLIVAFGNKLDYRIPIGFVLCFKIFPTESLYACNESVENGKHFGNGMIP